MCAVTEAGPLPAKVHGLILSMSAWLACTPLLLSATLQRCVRALAHHPADLLERTKFTTLAAALHWR
jgi:hypothetical protein